MPDVFLSYNREDQAVARRFAEAIVAADTQPSDTYQADTPQADTGQPDTGQADAYEVDAHQVDTQPTIDLSDTLLILVGRGSRDPEALAEFDEFARRHAANVGCRESRTADRSAVRVGRTLRSA